MKNYLSVFLAASVFLTVMPVRVSTAFALQPAAVTAADTPALQMAAATAADTPALQVAAVTAADTPPARKPAASGKMKNKPKSKVSVKDGEYEITVDRNAVQKSAGKKGERDSGPNVEKYIKPLLKYIVLLVLWKIVSRSLRWYRNKDGK